MGSRGTLLCIDDDATSVAVRKLLLQRFGYTVLTSTKPQEAIEIFAAEAIEGVILDYHMADRDGGQVAAVMRQIKPQVPILMLSAHPIVPESMRAMVDACIVKGEPPEVLISQLDEMLAA